MFFCPPPGCFLPPPRIVFFQTVNNTIKIHQKEYTFGVTEVRTRSKILTPLETTGGNTFSLEEFEKMLFTIWNDTQGDLHSTGGIQISFQAVIILLEGLRYPSLGVIITLEGFRYLSRGFINPGKISESFQWDFKPLRKYFWIPPVELWTFGKISESLQWKYKPLGGISKSLQRNYKPPGKISESLQWNYKPLGRIFESLQWKPVGGYLNPSWGIINPQEGFLNSFSGIINSWKDIWIIPMEL